MRFPTRRNRNIGTAKRGHGQDNRMVIPDPTRRCTALLQAHRKLQRDVQGKQITFIVEETNGGCIHACSVEDVAFLLSHLPLSDWVGLDTFVLRQPTRKARLLDPAWGRMFYHAEIGFGGRVIHCGPTVFLDAFELDTSIAWSSSLDPEDAEELARLRLDGHPIERVGRRYIVAPTAESVRATQLYRTLPHEIGHWFDWLEKVETQLGRGGEYYSLSRHYFARPMREREAFAHRFADEFHARLARKGVIPFPRIDG